MRRAQRGRTGQSCGSLISMVKRDQMYILHMYEIRLCPRSMFSYHVSLNNRTCVDALVKAGCRRAQAWYHTDLAGLWLVLLQMLPITMMTHLSEPSFPHLGYGADIVRLSRRVGFIFFGGGW